MIIPMEEWEKVGVEKERKDINNLRKLTIIAIVISIIAVGFGVWGVTIRGPQGPPGPQGKQGPPGTFEGKYHKIDIWEGSGNFYSHAFYIKGYVCRVQLMANASIPTFAELKMYLYTGVNRTIVFMQELSSSDFQLNPRGELYYIFVEPGYYYLSIDSIFINFWSVRIDTFY